jgi:hypothetical protein
MGTLCSLLQSESVSVRYWNASKGWDHIATWMYVTHYTIFFENRWNVAATLTRAVCMLATCKRDLASLFEVWDICNFFLCLSFGCCSPACSFCKQQTAPHAGLEPRPVKSWALMGLSVHGHEINFEFLFFSFPHQFCKNIWSTNFFCKTIHLAPWRTPCPPRYVPTRRKTKLAIGATDWTEPRARERSLPGASFFLYSFLFNKFFSYIIYVYNLPLHKKLCAQLIIYRKIMYTTCR